MVCIGLIADTHVPHRMASLPQALFERLADVDLILHAGDLDDPAILDDLGQIAPVQAVRGNVHLQSFWPNDQHLPLLLDLDIEGRRVIVTHGHLSLWNSFLEKFGLLLPDPRGWSNRRVIGRLMRAFPGADVYVFGHSHRALVECRNGALFVNPGAICPTKGERPSLSRLTVELSGADAEIVLL